MTDKAPPSSAVRGDLADDWRELLVPFDGSQRAEQVLRRACRTARRDGDGLAVLCVVQLPATGAPPPDDDRLDATAMSALARAQAICGEEGIVGVFKLTYARNLADAIVAEARRCGAALICLSLDGYDEHDPGDTELMSVTVQSVLAAAPCTVLIDAAPGAEGRSMHSR